MNLEGVGGAAHLATVQEAEAGRNWGVASAGSVRLLIGVSRPERLHGVGSVID